MKRKATLRTTMMKAQHNSGSNLAATGPMQGWLRWLIASLVCTLALLWTPPPVHAQSTVVVTNANDAGAGSLRQALADTAAGGAIVFDNTLAGATIRLASQLTLSKNVTIDGSALATPLTISGDTNNDGTGDVRAFTVNSGVTATLKKLTITKGSALSYAPPYGGAIYNEGDLTIVNSSLTSNQGDYAGAVGNWGTLRVRGSTFASNQANHQGGAIMNFGTLDIANSTITANSAGSYGGGISNVERGATTLANVTIWQNAANAANLADSTATSGGGIYVSGTATANPSVLAYANTLIAGSTKGNDCEIRLARSTLSVNQSNFVGDGTGQCSAAYSGNPLLGALANNGGPTQTAAPSVGSPVIDAGNDAYCASAQVGNVDQRGVTRPWGAHCDIGAVEYAEVTPSTAPVAGRNGALAFDGTSDYVSLSPDTGKVSATSLGLPVKDITVEAWVNIAQFKKWSAFVGFLQDNGASEWGWALGTWGTPEADGVYFGLSTTGTGATYLSDYSVLANRWVHLAGTYDGTTMKLYVDGDLMNSSTAQSGNIAYADSWYRLGSYKDDDEEFRIQGAMDEVRVWNVARSQADIQADMYRRLTGAEAGLVSYWPMDEGSGTVTNDHKGTLNGTLVGLPAWMKTGPAIRPGLDLSLATADDTPLNDALIGMDPDGGALTFVAITQPAHGALQITNAQTGAFTYTPTLTYNGTDSFTYRVTDAQSLTDDATVTIAVRSVNSPPVAGRNGALTFDGANDIVDLGNVAALNGVNRYTLEGWVRFTAFNNYATVLAKRQGDGDRAVMIQLYGASGQVAVAVNNGYGYSSSTVPLNKWVHLAAVYDGTQATNADRLKLYIDGAPASLTFLSSVPATTPTSATRLTLGAEYNGTAPVSSVSPLQVPLAGQIDEVRLWNGTRSQSEIQAAMYSRMRGAEAGLVGYWPLDEGSGNTTADKAGSQTGVLIGGPGWIDSSLPLRPGLDLTFATLANIPVSNTLVGIDPEGGAVTYAVFTAPAHGAVQISDAQSGAFTYTPATNFVGADAFVYQVADTGGLTDTATVTVTMSPPATGAIEGVVFDDLNGNGVKDVGEAGVAGVTVSRSGGADTATVSDGAYRFGDVPVGSYTVSIGVPAGYVASGQTSRTVSVASGGAARANFALQAQGVIQGVVFDDLNGNKAQDLGEPGIAGVTITRGGGPDATTGDDGSYRFSSVSPGSYTLLVSVPAGYVAVGQTSSTVNVASGSSARANFILQTQGVIQGVVFDDRNGNGAQDSGEPGVGGVAITRDDGPDTTTGVDGSYRFTDVVPGDYMLFVSVPAGYVSVGQTSRMVDVVNGSAAQANFALQAQGVIQGVVFEDRNGNGEQDSGEPGVGGVAINRDDGPSATTSDDGSYRFSNVNAGAYTLFLSVPAGFFPVGQTSRTVNVASGGAGQANFSLQAQGAIQGVVYEDLNGNGRQDTGEPGIGGVTVNRSGGAGTATSLDGSYRFSNVSVGSYTLAIAVPAGYVAVGRTSRTVSVASGGAAQANFSVQAQGVIQGLVFDDRNGNGVQDSGETGINGAAITRGDGPSTATSMDGTYRFTDVVPGIYTLAITVPDGYVAVGQTRRTVSVPSGGSVRSNFILQARGVIQGVVFDDFNGNGVQDSDEAGVGGVVVSQSSGVTTTTSLDGGYRFSNVAPGSYTLGIAVPAGYVPAGPSTSTVNVAIGGSVQANFAVQVQGVLGVVFDDLNGNNRQDGGEPGLGGVSIALEGGATVITSLDGKYRFSNVAPGSYILYLDVPAGYVSVGRTSRTVTVAAGGSARANFALQAESVLQGVVFDDLNGNGAQDVGEAGVGGVTITRDDGPDTTTSGDGSYSFTSVVPGGYTLFLGVPAGYISVGQTSRVVNVASGGSAQANFAVQAQGVIQGVVFDDRNGNNEQDTGEPGVGGVVVSQSSGVTATTSSDGSYRFSNINPGSYTLGIAVPSGFVATGQTIRTVNVGSGGAAQANFALQAQGAIQGVVFDDRNGNGRQDSDEPGIGGVAISRNDGPSVATASDGSYRFSSVTVGSYTLSISLPAGYVAVGRTSRTVSVAPGGAAQANFALQAQGVIQGLVFDDRNGNGVQDAGESGVGGVTIMRGDGPDAATNLDGMYRFTDVVPGVYVLAITVPDSYVAVGQTSRTVNVGSGGSVQSNFILQARGVIQGVVFDDFNGNGVQDSSESGVGGVTVSRDGTDTTTASDGSYRFGDVAPGSYTLSIAAPAGYVAAGQTTSTVNVAIGGAVQANFALQVQGVLGVVFDDLNGNGLQDGGEPGIGGVTIIIEDGPTATTSLDGKYRFSNVAPESYMLFLELPAGYVSVGRTNRTVTVAAGGSARANFALQAESVLQGVVFDDLNGNGAQDVGEAGVGGVTITRDDGPDTTTSGDGSYSFTSVVPGGYTLFLGVPAGYISVGQTSRTVNVASGGSAQANFAVQAQGVIQGVVFDDRNGNNEQDTGEPGVGGVVVSQSSGVTATTSSDGSYRFSNINPGSYTLGIAVPSGFVATGQTIRTVNVGSGGAAQANFALQAQGVIQGVVFDDRNGNGRQDSGEPGVGGVTISRGAGQETVTGGDGSYRFSAVSVGSHTVTVSVPAGYLPFGRTSRTVNVASGSAAQANFILQAQGVIQGVVFDDRNGNGVQESGEPGIGGVALTRGDGPVAATSLDGAYVFTDVVPGRYTLSVTIPDGYIAGGLTTRTVNVASGGSSAANFALQTQGLIQGVVFEDTDGNGQQESNEAGIGGVTVTVNALGSVETQSDGTYRYTNVPVGNYTVVATLPAGYAASTLLTQPVGMPSGGSRVANFGLQVQGMIQGVVFSDGNGNAAQESGEDGVSGVTVRLVNRATEQLVAQGPTGVNGSYRFAALGAGQYRVEVEAPTGYTIAGGAATVAVDLGATSSAVANFALRVPNSIFGALFVDMNANALRDAGEAGVAGVTLQLQSDASTLDTVTAADGGYLFSNLSAGVYTVAVGSLAGTGYTISGPSARLVSLPAGATNVSAAALFTALPEASLSGVTEPGSDVGLTGGGQVHSSSEAAVMAVVRVNSLGIFQFLGVAPGDYTIVVTPPPGFTAPLPAIPVTFSGAGARLNKADTQLLVNGAIRGRLFEDIDGNASADLHEQGVGGIVVQLLAGDSVMQQVTAAANGSYQFSGVPAGIYRVNVAAGEFVQTNAVTATLTTERPGANLDVSMSRQGAISGRIFRADVGATAGLENFPVTLTGAAQASTLTDADGFFHFDGLPAGAYAVDASQAPAAFFAVGSSNRTVMLNTGASGNGINFGFILRANAPTALDPEPEPDAVVPQLYLPAVMSEMTSVVLQAMGVAETAPETASTLEAAGVEPAPAAPEPTAAETNAPAAEAVAEIAGQPESTPAAVETVDEAMPADLPPAAMPAPDALAPTVDPDALPNQLHLPVIVR